ncbi:MAG: hypothetical protein N4A74_20735 [Carboxylicivirga sp.]|jgi:hypothetical protein|nr:hypothetical protein [Carboxylicivirga sp.]
MKAKLINRGVILGLIVLLFSCVPEDITYYDNNIIDKDSITGIRILPSHFQVIADGRAELDLQPVVYKTVDSIIALNDRVPTEWIEYYEKSGVETKRFFTTNNQELVGQDLKVWARIKGTDIESDTVTFKVREPLAEDAYDEIVIPIVFHVLQSEGDIKAKGKKLRSEKVEQAIKRLNNVFSGIASRNPNGVDTKISFEAAKYNPEGKMLIEPGINRLEAKHKLIGYGERTFEWFIRDLHDNIDEDKKDDYYIPENGNNINWPVEKYFQVWLISSDEYDNFGDKVSEECYPMSKYTDADLTNMPKGLKLSRNETNLYMGAKRKGLKIRLQDFVNTRPLSYKAKSNDWIYYVGIYFGLLPNHKKPYSAGWSWTGTNDYCNDTFLTYVSWYDSYYGRIPSKYNMNRNSTMYKQVSGVGYEFLAENIMDAPQGLHQSISKDQAARIRWILENSPERQFWKSDFAFTGIEDL